MHIYICARLGCYVTIVHEDLECSDNMIYTIDGNVFAYFVGICDFKYLTSFIIVAVRAVTMII